MFPYCIKVILIVLPVLFLLPGQGWSVNPAWQKQVMGLVKDGAVLVTDFRNRKLFSLNHDKPLIPASIIKIVTADAAIQCLGADYRFTTEFRLSPDNDIYVIGKGDPHLISEELERVVRQLKSKGLTRVRNIFLDDGYFKRNLVLHGTNRSLNPYDAFNGALCVNFNTIYVKIGPKKNVFSAEPQTPITDFARKIALRSGLKGTVRINLAENPEKCLLYAGELLKRFLEKSSIRVKGRIARAEKDPERFPLFYLHRSSWDLSEILKKMFKHSNNFLANQIFLTMGAVRHGPPATVEKSRSTMAHLFTRLGLKGLHVEEGSGLSRRTRISAVQMIKVLNHFRPHLSLLTHKDTAWFKTGSLSNVKSIAGYLVKNDSRPMAFAIILNGKNFSYRTRDKVFSLIKENLISKSY